jgi:hypothetical protein
LLRLFGGDESGTMGEGLAMLEMGEPKPVFVTVRSLAVGLSRSVDAVSIVDDRIEDCPGRS